LLPSKLDLEGNHEEVSRPVLTLTSDAAEAVKTIAEALPELPNESGLRIQAQVVGEEGQVSFDLAMVESPDEGDQVIEEAGARVFVEPDAALILEDKILDATVAGNQVQFSLSEQD
jgi:iron-sulfur cluster assembly protein